MVAFQGMHVSPAKHSYAGLPRKCDYRTDTRMDRHRQMLDKEIPIYCYALQATQKAKTTKTIKTLITISTDVELLQCRYQPTE